MRGFRCVHSSLCEGLSVCSSIHPSVLPSVRPSVPPFWLAGPQAWLAGPKTWLAGPQIWLAGPQAWLAVPQAWLAGPQIWLAGPHRLTENLPILQEFAPYQGRCPAYPHETKEKVEQGKRTAVHLMPMGD